MPVYQDAVRISRRGLLAATATSLFLGRSVARADTFDRTRTLVIAIPADPVNLDPGTNRAEPIGSEIILNVFDTLVAWQQDKPTELEGRLADRWQVSADGKDIQIHLRPHVLFHDDTAVNAAAVKFSLERTRALNPYMQSNLEAVSAILVDGELDLIIRLSRPLPFFLPLLVQPQAAIVSPTAVQSRGDRFRVAPVGSGAFRCRSYDPDTSLQLEGNPHYFRGAPSLARIVYRVIGDASTRRLELESGDVDILQQSGQLAALPMEDVKAFRRNPAIQVIEAPSQILRQLEFNNRHPDSPIKDLRVRRAIACAIDYDGLINQVLGGTVDRAWGPLPTSNWAYDPAVAVAGFRYEPARARALLADAGYPPGVLKFRLYTFQGSFWATVATFLQSNLAGVGIGIQIEQLEFPAYRARHVAGDFELALDGRSTWYSDPDAHITVGYLSRLATSAMTFRMPDDAGLDSAILAAQSEPDPVRRRALYGDVQRQLMDRVPAVYLFTNKLIVFARSNVHGLHLQSAPPLTEYWSVYKNEAG